MTMLATSRTSSPTAACRPGWSPNITKRGWLGRDRRKADFCTELVPAHVETILRLLANIRARGLPLYDVTLADFSEPALDAFLAGLVQELVDGDGLIFLRGLPATELSEQDLRYIYWGVGLHFGKPLVQSFQGDQLGEIRVNPSNIQRPYQNSTKLPLHCALMDFFSMMGVRKAKAGGGNIFGSSLAVWELMAGEHPEHFEFLKGNLRWGFPKAEPWASLGVPIFAEVGGIRSVFYPRDTNDPPPGLTPGQAEAFDRFTEICERDTVRLHAELEAGEMVFINNFEVMHARTQFVDWDETTRKRLLFRLWLQANPPRPRVPEQSDLVAKVSASLGIAAEP
jgi:hypothetical protein